MSTLRKTFKVVIDNGAPLFPVTSARDLMVAQEFGEDHPLIAFVPVWAALRRQGVDPGTLDEFVDRLDEFEAIDEPSNNGAGDDLDPTSVTDSVTGP